MIIIQNGYTTLRCKAQTAPHPILTQGTKIFQTVHAYFLFRHIFIVGKNADQNHLTCPKFNNLSYCPYIKRSFQRHG